MTIFTEPMTVKRLREALETLPEEAAVWVHASNGFGPGGARALGRIEAGGSEVHLYGSYF